MRKHLIFLGILAVILLGPLAFSGRGQAPASGEQAVRTTVAAYIEALNKGNLDGVMAYWAPDADFIDESGKPVRGHDALTARFRTTLPTLKGSKVSSEVYSVKFLRPEV